MLTRVVRIVRDAPSQGPKNPPAPPISPDHPQISPAAAFLAAGFSVADPGEVTKANVGVADVHHHQNIFNGEILKPLLPALERICPE